MILGEETSFLHNSFITLLDDALQSTLRRLYVTVQDLHEQSYHTEFPGLISKAYPQHIQAMSPEATPIVERSVTLAGQIDE